MPAMPIIEEIFNINLSESHLKYAFDTIIFPHFGIPSNNLTPINNIHIGNIQFDNIQLDQLYNIQLQLSNKINEFDILLSPVFKKIGYIVLDIIGIEITLKHIELDSQYRNKKLSIISIIQLMYILSARYAPINPILITNNISIAKKLNFTKLIDGYFKRPCRSIF